MSSIFDTLARLPVIGTVGRRLHRLFRRQSGSDEAFSGTAAYWQARYAAGGNSGAGSYGKFAEFKARILNALFAEQGVVSGIEFGSGDGNQLKLLRIANYTGVDISPDAVARCRTLYAGQPGCRFMTTDEYAAAQPVPRADCTLSLDVIYHLVEDETFDTYMGRLFASASKLVVVYSSNHDAPVQADGSHIRHRCFTDWVAARQPGWRMLRQIPNDFPFKGDYKSGSFADFYIFVRAGGN